MNFSLNVPKFGTALYIVRREDTIIPFDCHIMREYFVCVFACADNEFLVFLVFILIKCSHPVNGLWQSSQAFSMVNAQIDTMTKAKTKEKE